MCVNGEIGCIGSVNRLEVVLGVEKEAGQMGVEGVEVWKEGVEEEDEVAWHEGIEEAGHIQWKEWEAVLNGWMLSWVWIWSNISLCLLLRIVQPGKDWLVMMERLMFEDNQYQILLVK